MPYTPSDNFIGPIVNEIATIIENNITGIDRIYQTIPDGPPEDNSVLIPLTQFEVLDETSGKAGARLTFGIRHMIRRKDMGEALTACYSYIMPYFLTFSAWSNQSLNGKARLLTIEKGGVTQFIEAGQVFLALIINLQVFTEFNIPTT